MSKTNARNPWVWTAAIGLATFASACAPGSLDDGDSGAPGEPAGSSDDGEDTDGVGGSGAIPGESEEEPEALCGGELASTDLRVMARAEYENTIEDLLSLDRTQWSTDEAWLLVRPEFGGGMFGLRELGSVDPAVFEGFAAEIAAQVDPASILPCVDSDACAESFVVEFGRRAWRRPLAEDEVATIMSAFDGVGLEEGARAALLTLLSSPQFWALQQTGAAADGAAPGVIALDDWSLATRMSFFLWDSTPDQALLDRAAAGELVDPAVRLAEAERMLADPRGTRMIERMYTEWFRLQSLPQLERPPEQEPQFGPATAEAMAQEVRMFVSDVVFGYDGNLDALLNAPFSYVNDQLAWIYGDDLVAGADSVGASFSRVELDPERRGGLLTLPGMLAQHTSAPVSPTRRGLVVREMLLCQPIPPPPDAIEGSVEPSDSTDRNEAWRALSEIPECATCHALSDPPGFAFDNYDIYGRWQDQVEGVDVDSSGRLLGVDDEIDFTGWNDLTDQLAEHSDVRDCVVSVHLERGLGRGLQPADACSQESLREQFEQSGGNLRSLVIEVVGSSVFGLANPA